MSHFIHSSICRWTVKLISVFLAITNNMAINICVHVFMCKYVLFLLEILPRSGTAESILNVLKNCQTVFQSAYTILHS